MNFIVPVAAAAAALTAFAGAAAVEVNREPMRIMADAALVARRETVEPFLWTHGD